MMKALATAAILTALAAPAAAAPIERRLHSDAIDASSFLWNDWNKFVENYHPNYVADDDPVTAWVEGGKTSGAGEWLRISVTPLDKTTRVRLRVRNGYQKSKELWKANARAKAVTVRLLPGKTEKQVVLTDSDDWQEVTVDQPSGTLRAIELAIRSVYEGTKYADLCISDVQVYATSETPDNPAFEKGKLDNLMSWRAARIDAAKVFAAKKVELPIYPSYEIQRTEGGGSGAATRAAILEAAVQDPVFSKEWKDALAAAAALEQNPGRMTRAQIAPASTAKFVEVDGLEVTRFEGYQIGIGPWLSHQAIRLPMLDLISAMFADQLRVLDVKDRMTIAQFEQPTGPCVSSAAWVGRAQPKEGGPSRVTAVAVGRCGNVPTRAGPFQVRRLELLIYDAAGKLVLVVGDGHIEGYRWTTEAGKPMLAGGRSLTWERDVIEARRRVPAATK
jgi:hypothetical protein